MFFGMCSSLVTFQAMVDKIFKKEIEGDLIIVYMDDTLGFLKTLDGLKKIEWIVLEKAREHDLFFKAKKCEFRKQKIKYLVLGDTHFLHLFHHLLCYLLLPLPMSFLNNTKLSVNLILSFTFSVCWENWKRHISDCDRWWPDMSWSFLPENISVYHQVRSAFAKHW